jgi:lipoyl(octanoyl) transferase
MERRVAAIAAGQAPELVWLLEHPPLYTAGTSAHAEDLLDARFPVFRSGRGGQYTYHGPGQRVVYLMLDLRRRVVDVRRFVAALELWLVRSLRQLGVRAETRHDRVGVWVRRDIDGGRRDEKIAAIGVRVKRFVTMHGLSLNVAPDLAHFTGIVPCGLAPSAYGVTSLAALGRPAALTEVDAVLHQQFAPIFGPCQAADGNPCELAADAGVHGPTPA